MKEKEKSQVHSGHPKKTEDLKEELNKAGQTSQQEQAAKSEEIKGPQVYDNCPHCGRELSPWEKVLLSVDRMLMCKNCWYRIVLDVLSEDKK